MKTISATTFRKKFLATIRYVKKKRKAVMITRYGKPVARLVPKERTKGRIFGFMRGRGRIVGDIVSSLPRKGWGSLK
jgi:prevent-host-death family protein